MSVIEKAEAVELNEFGEETHPMHKYTLVRLSETGLPDGHVSAIQSSLRNRGLSVGMWAKEVDVAYKFGHLWLANQIRLENWIKFGAYVGIATKLSESGGSGGQPGPTALEMWP